MVGGVAARLGTPDAPAPATQEGRKGGVPGPRVPSTAALAAVITPVVGRQPTWLVVPPLVTALASAAALAPLGPVGRPGLTAAPLPVRPAGRLLGTLGVVILRPFDVETLAAHAEVLASLVLGRLAPDVTERPRRLPTTAPLALADLRLADGVAQDGLVRDALFLVDNIRRPDTATFPLPLPTTVAVRRPDKTRVDAGPTSGLVRARVAGPAPETLVPTEGDRDGRAAPHAQVGRDGVPPAPLLALVDARDRDRDTPAPFTAFLVAVAGHETPDIAAGRRLAPDSPFRDHFFGILEDGRQTLSPKLYHSIVTKQQPLRRRTRLATFYLFSPLLGTLKHDFSKTGDEETGTRHETTGRRQEEGQDGEEDGVGDSDGGDTTRSGGRRATRSCCRGYGTCVASSGTTYGWGRGWSNFSDGTCNSC